MSKFIITVKIVVDILLGFTAWSSEKITAFILNNIHNYDEVIKSLDLTVKLSISCLVLITVIFRLMKAGRIKDKDEI